MASATPTAAIDPPLFFDPRTGQLTIQGHGGKDPIREEIATGGFLEVTLNGQRHDSDPSSAGYDPALAGANRTTLARIVTNTDDKAPFVLGTQTLTGGLTVRANGPVTTVGSVVAGGVVAISAPAITVSNTLSGAAVTLTSAGTVSVESRGGITVDRGGAGSRVEVAGSVFVNTGQIHADGGTGNQVLVRAGNVLNAGRITADGVTADGGRVRIEFTGIYLDIAAAATSAHGGPAGRGGSNPNWNNFRGAVTWGDGNQGLSGVISSDNSLVGGDPGDDVGLDLLTLTNGDYAVSSTIWNQGRGAVTWGDGATGVRGEVSAANSLVGSGAGDRVGSYTLALSNSDYLVTSPSWNGQRGAVTWADGGTGVRGPISSANSLVGSHALDQIGSGTNPPFNDITLLSHGNYVVYSPAWNHGSGAVTWGDGTAGTTGPVSDQNSLVG